MKEKKEFTMVIVQVSSIKRGAIPTWGGEGLLQGIVYSPPSREPEAGTEVEAVGEHGRLA